MQPRELAETLTGPARHRFDELVAGIERAQLTLESAFLLMVWAYHLDFEGCWDELVSMAAFDDASAATLYSDAFLHSLALAGAGPCTPTAIRAPDFNSSTVPLLTRTAVSVAGNNEYERDHITVITAGPFSDGIIKVASWRLGISHKEVGSGVLSALGPEGAPPLLLGSVHLHFPALHWSCRYSRRLRSRKSRTTEIERYSRRKLPIPEWAKMAYRKRLSGYRIAGSLGAKRISGTEP